MKKLMILFLLLSFMCFGEEQTEPKKSYEVVQGEEIEFLKTQLIKSNNKIDDLTKKIEKLEYKEENNFASTYSVDQIYQNSMQYYDKTVKFIILLITGVGTVLAILLGLLSGFNNKKIKEERAEIRDDAKDLKKEVKEIMREKKEEITKEVGKKLEEIRKENKELKQKLVEQEKEVERKTLELNEKIEQVNKEMDEKIKTVEFNTELAIAINNSSPEEKIEELKKIVDKYPKKAKIYFELGKCLANEKNSYEEAISYFNKINELEPKKNIGHLCIGLAYEHWGDDKKKEENYIDTKKYFQEAIKNYKMGIKLDSNAKNFKVAKEKLKRTQKKLKELEGE